VLTASVTAADPGVEMKKTNHITRAAVLAAVNIVLLLSGQLIRTNTLSFLALASFVTAAAVIYIDMKHAFYMYIVTSATAFIFIPDKAIAILYTSFFGIYGLVKLFIERLNNSYLEFGLKSGFFVSIFYINYLLIGDLLIDFDSLFERFGFPEYVFVIMFILVFNIYDFVYSAVIRFIYKRMDVKRS
jgi:hypothetical protein